MKKKLFLFAALACTAVAGFVLTSCGDDDEPAVKKSMEITYKVELAEGIHQAAAVVIEYVDENGKKKFDNEITGKSTWEKTITTTKGNGTYGVHVALSGKGDYPNDTYDMGITTSISGRSSTGSQFTNNGTPYANPTL